VRPSNLLLRLAGPDVINPWVIWPPNSANSHRFNVDEFLVATAAQMRDDHGRSVKK